MNGKARLAPNGLDKARRIELLEAFANRFPVKKLAQSELIDAIGQQEWDAYWARCSEIEAKLKEAQHAAETIRVKLKSKLQQA